MRMNRTFVGTICIAGLAFAAGRLSLSHDSEANAANPQDEMSAEMEAWMKAGTPGKNHK